MTLDTVTTIAWWGIVPLIAAGSVLHFVYDWSGHHRLAAVFSAVNESYWEHTKIAVWPVAALHLVLFAFGGWRLPAFIPAATIALYSIPVAMIGLVFLYKRLARRNILALDIAVFAVTIVIAQVVFILMLEQLAANTATIVIAACFLAGLVASFLVFTLTPPAEPDLFVDPLTRRYGRSGHGGDPRNPLPPTTPPAE